MKESDSVRYIGVKETNLKIFENQYPLSDGISFNSYVILDKKVAVMDSVDQIAGEKWIANLKKELNGRTVDFLIISHMEPDHSANILQLINEYPKVRLVGNKNTFRILNQFYPSISNDYFYEVSENDTLNLGEHELVFKMAPMVHWPEVMVEYEKSEKILFSADAFGTFGTNDKFGDNWVDEASRYYFNICGKYGAQVQNLLKKVKDLDIKMICPLHGPILKDDLTYYLNKYDFYSKYEPEYKNKILVVCASIHGNTKKATDLLAEKIKEKGKDVQLIDLCQCRNSYAISEAFRCPKMVLACSTYDSDLFTPMKNFLASLLAKGYQNRKVGLIENGSWAPMAAKIMKEQLLKNKDIEICETIISIKSAINQKNELEMDELIREL